MKIVYIGAFRFPIFDAAAARVLNIGRALRELGYDVYFISWGGKYIHQPNISGWSLYDGFNYYISGELNEKNPIKKLRNKFFSGEDSLRILRQWVDDDDIVIAYNPDWSFNKKMLKLHQKNKFKYVVDLTEWYDNNELKITDCLPNWINMTRTNSKRVKNRILISSYFYRKYPEGNNVIIPATCNSKDIKWNCEKIIDCNRITLIYAGNPAKKDKLHDVINAVEMVQVDFPGKVQLLVLGIDKHTYLKRYSKYLENKTISPAIEFIGKVNQNEVPSYYAKSDYMVMLRDSTRKANAGFPTKFSEAMMSGTPVIANITSDLDSFLKDGYNGYIVQSPTAKSLYDVLIHRIFHLSREEINRQHENAKHTGLSCFHYDNYNSILKDFINNLQ